MQTNNHALDPGWVLQAHDQTDYTPPALANGMIGLVPARQPLQWEPVILNGVYDRYGADGVARILSGIAFTNLDLGLAGQRLSADPQVSDWQQQLHLYEAHLTTTFTWGGKLQVQQRAYALRQLPHAALITLTLTALADVEVTVHHTLAVPAVLQPQAQRFRFYHEVPGTPLFTATATSPTGRHEISAATVYLFAAEPPPLIHETGSDREHTVRFTLKLAQGATYHFGIVGAICSTAHFADPINEAERIATFAKFQGESTLVARHQQAWAKLWESDIAIEGDLAAQQAVRLALYNLYAFVRAGSRLSVSPMGLSSLGYNGHVFWDSELWMYPPLLVLQPELARSLLDYRFDRLAAAQRKAETYGYEGAMFPWESDDRGEECTPTWAVTGAFEHHITACVGIAFWNYYLVTGDQGWLRTEGYPLLAQVAQFWVSRVERNAAGQYEINYVVGADEYTGVVHNNAFTNGAAMTVLRYATQAAQVLGLEPDPQWRTVADNLLILTFPDGTTQEYAGYDGRIIKQADVNLLAYPLKLISAAAEIRRDLDYYEPRYDLNAPAMSHSILAILAAHLGERERAAAFFTRSYQPNQKPPFGVLAETPFSNNPYFATAAGGMLQAVLFGLGGLTLSERGVEPQPPCLPARWQALTIRRLGEVILQVDHVPDAAQKMPG